jgi:hypothetical protein
MAQEEPKKPETSQTPLSPEELQKMKNELEELKRKKEEAEQLLEQQRQQNLEMMAQMSRFQTPPPISPEPEEPTEDYDSLFLQQPTKAVKKILEKEKETLFKDLPKYVSEEAIKVFYRERFKQDAMTKYPDLKNPSSEFYKRVANFMYERPHLYQDPEGVLNACARVAEDMGIKRQEAKQSSFEEQRRAVASQGVEGAGATLPAKEEAELDVQGKILAQKLGISEKAMIERLDKFVKKEGEYKQEPGTSRYKARL